MNERSDLQPFSFYLEENTESENYQMENLLPGRLQKMEELETKMKLFFLVALLKLATN